MTGFLDQARGLWAKGALQGKVGGALASLATQHGGQETTLFTSTTIAGLDAQWQPSENELAGARYQVRAIAETAAKLRG